MWLIWFLEFEGRRCTLKLTSNIHQSRGLFASKLPSFLPPPIYKTSAVRTVTIFSSVNPCTLKSHLQRKFRQPFNYVSEIKLIAPLFYTPKLILLPAWCFFFITRQNVVQTCKQWSHLRSLIPGRIKNGSIQHNLNTVNTSCTAERYRKKVSCHCQREERRYRYFGTNGKKWWTSRPGHFTSVKGRRCQWIQGWLGPRASPDGFGEKEFALFGIRIPHRPQRSVPLYRLHYRGSPSTNWGP